VLPLSPGGIGLYEGAFTLIVFGLTNVAAPVAFAISVVDHVVKNAVTIVGGLVSMAWLNVSLTEAVEESREADHREASERASGGTASREAERSEADGELDSATQD
jgi:hypothetical protein